MSLDFSKYENTLDWSANQVEYNNEECRIEEQFRLDTLAYHNMPDNAITRKMLAIAWENGHSCGYSEVFNEFWDFVDLWEVIQKSK